MYNRKKVRALNDAFRETLHGGRVVATSSVAQHPHFGAILNMIRTFSHFSERNDPYQEHDFGAFIFEDQHFFWKIDAYDPDLTNSSLDPSDPTITCRILTVMLASEY